MNYAETIQYLYSLRWFGAKLGLENTRQLAELSGNPHERLRFIHVAGTNGKGSTCAMLESIYRAAGLRVGLFTSPHLVSFSERIQVNRIPIAEQEVVDQLARLRPLLAQFSEEHHPTFFEVITVLALRYFAEQRCDLVVWETGLGGRLDATNIVTPLVSVITNIQYDHQKWLGETLASIAFEKAGIIKPGVPVLTAATEPEALDVIVRTARERGAPLTLVTDADAHQSPLDRLSLSLLGEHQKLNAALALKTASVLRSDLPFSETEAARALSQVFWPGRLQLLTRPNGQKVLLDGAHNPAGAATLATTVRQQFGNRARSIILGILGDKDWKEMCRILAPLAPRVLLVPVHSERTASPGDLGEACRRANPGAEVRECASLEAALEEAAADEFVILAGSLYLVGEALETLQPSPGATHGERALNEWGAAKPALSVPPRH